MADSAEPVRVAIVDDDAPSRRVVAAALQQYPWCELCGEAESCAGAEKLVADLQPDLLFLDIELNDESALNVMRSLKTLGHPGMKIVFYTAYMKYHMQALRMEAFDFLLKPFDPEEMRLIMSRYQIECRDSRRSQSDEIALARSRALAAPSGLSITTLTNDRMILFPRDIIFFRYDNERKIWEVVLSTLQHFLLRRNTTAETILNYGPQFVRTHKAYIVNVSYIAMISGNECRLLPPYDKIADIRISKVYRRPLLDCFYDI